MGKSWKKWLIIGIIVSAFIGFLALGGQRYLSLEALKEQREAFGLFYENNVALTITLFVGIYILVTALSLPGAAIMTLGGGALFGLGLGTALVSISSTIGATCAFIVARYLFQDVVQTKFGEKLKVINEGVKKEGAFYLFSLRLIPAFPFFMVNLLMAMTPIKVVTFFFVSQIGMLPGTLVYVNAGTQLAQIESLDGILTPELLGSFILLGVFPLLAKKVMGWIRTRDIK